MPDTHTLAQTEKATADRIDALPIDIRAAHAVSSLYRAANSARSHLTNTVLRRHDLTWTGFLVLWLLWIWRSMGTRDVAESVGISKATLTGVANTLISRGWLERAVDTDDRRLVNLSLSPAGVALMDELYPEFNSAETEIVRGLTPEQVGDLTAALRTIVTTLEGRPAEPRAGGAPRRPRTSAPPDPTGASG